MVLHGRCKAYWWRARANEVEVEMGSWTQLKKAPMAMTQGEKGSKQWMVQGRRTHQRRYIKPL